MATGIFPWQGGNRFELLIDGIRFFPQMIQAISEARQSVDLELYLVEDGQCCQALIEALAHACQRGVRVRCLFDDFGSRGLSRASRLHLSGQGAQLRFYNPLSWRRLGRNFYRDHRKLLVVDETLAFVGGTGATDAFWRPGQAQDDWHEVMVQMHGPLVRHWQALFEHQWQLSWQRRPWKPDWPLWVERLPPLPSQRGGLGRVAYADARQHRDILQSLVRNLRRARTRIWLATPYFLPTWKVRRALRRAARRGVDVRLLLSGGHTDHPSVRYAGHRYYSSLLRKGVRIFEYQPRFLHLKMVLVDDWVSVGSCNFDHWNLRFNLDANLEALDPGLTEAVEQSFHQDFAVSREISQSAWRQRPWYRRLYQGFYGSLEQVVLKLFSRLR